MYCNFFKHFYSIDRSKNNDLSKAAKKLLKKRSENLRSPPSKLTLKDDNNGLVEISFTVIVADKVKGAITTSLLSSKPVKARKKASKGSSSRLVLVAVVPCFLLAVIKPNSAFRTSIV